MRQFFIIESLTNSCRDERGEKEKSKSALRPTLHFFASVTAGIDVLLRTLGCLVLANIKMFIKIYEPEDPDVMDKEL